MSLIDVSRRRFDNVTFPCEATETTESSSVVSTFGLSEDSVWWRWLIEVQLLRYGPALCVCIGSVGVALSVIVWIRIQRHLPPTLLYILVAIILEILPLYMHCGSYTLKQVILTVPL